MAVEQLSELRVMCSKGDVKVEWDKRDTKSVDMARTQFEEIKKKYPGSAFFKMGRFGLKGEQIFNFDPNAERILVVPPMAGG